MRPKRPSWTSPLTKANRTYLFDTCIIYSIMRHVGFYSLAFQIHHPCMCDECDPATIHRKTVYMYSLLFPIRAFPSEGRTSWVRRYCNLARVLVRIVLPVPLGTHTYAR
jgi:hypothetical protein